MKEQSSNTQIRQLNKKMSQLHLQQKHAFKKLFDSGIDIDYKDPKIVKLICNSIPSIYRSRVWPFLIQDVHGITPKFYQLLIKKAAIYIQGEANDVIPQRARMITHLKSIENDIERTYPQLKIFRKDNQQGQSLFNILTAWTVFREDIGYIQGMSQIAGLILHQLQLKQIESFTLFSSIMVNNTMHIYETMSMEDIQLFQHKFDKKLKSGDQQFYLLLKNNGIETRTYLLTWMLTLFTRTMSLDMVSKLWDILFVCNLSQIILIQTAYLLMEMLKARIKQDMQITQIYGIIKNFKLNDIEADYLIGKLRQSYNRYI